MIIRDKNIKLFNQKHTISISNNEINQRIDNLLLKYFKKVPKSHIYKLIRIGNIKVNKIKITPKYKLQINDIITTSLIYDNSLKKQKININIKKYNFIEKYILYEDKYLIVFNKPSGLAVHGGGKLNFGLIEILRFIRHKNNFLELVHRLDKETSGILIIAKKKIILNDLHNQFRQKIIKKNYLALLKGIFIKNEVVISKPLLKCKSITGEHFIKIHSKGKMSETYFNVKKRFKNLTLVKIIPITGRTHQIRVHCKYLGHPIVLDDKYGDKRFNKKIKKYTNIRHLFLYAYSIKFIHPFYKKNFYIKIPLNNLLNKYLYNLKNGLL